MTELSNVKFKYKPPSVTKLGHLKNLPIKKLYNIIGALKWAEETRTALCGKGKYERQIRHAIIADEEDEKCFKLTVWGGLIENITDGHTYIIKSVLLEDYYGLRLNTTSSTVFEAHSTQYNIKWSKFGIDDENVKMCSPPIQSIEINSFYQWINGSCKHKVSPFSGENKVTCDSCKRKMLVKRLIENSKIELELQDKVTGCDVIVTLFQNVLKNLFEIDEVTSDELQDKLLEAENLDIIYNKKEIVVSITSHSI